MQSEKSWMRNLRNFMYQLVNNKFLNHRCAVFNNVPVSCSLVPDPSDPSCCKIPSCKSAGTTPLVGINTPPTTVAPGVITGIGKIPTPSPGVYINHMYKYLDWPSSKTRTFRKQLKWQYYFDLEFTYLFTNAKIKWREVDYDYPVLHLSDPVIFFLFPGLPPQSGKLKT